MITALWALDQKNITIETIYLEEDISDHKYKIVLIIPI